MGLEKIWELKEWSKLVINKLNNKEIFVVNYVEIIYGKLLNQEKLLLNWNLKILIKMNQHFM